MRNSRKNWIRSTSNGRSWHNNGNDIMIPMRTLLACSFFIAISLPVAPAQGQLDALPHADTTSGNFFGAAVSLDGNRALVGASNEETCIANGGAAYIFEYDANTDRWAEVARLLPHDCADTVFFGRSVALSGDRALIASGIEYFARVRSHAAYLFERDTMGVWQQTATLTANTQEEEGPVGGSVSLDGNRALLTTSGDTARGRHSGAAYVFEQDTTTGHWEQTARLTGSGGLSHGIFGGSASLSGDRIVVSSSSYFQKKPGYFYVFEHTAEDTWEETALFGDIDDFFISLDIEGDRILVGESHSGRSDAGAATLYTRDSTGTWHLSTTLHPPVPYKQGGFGAKVALSGDRALVTGYDEQLRQNFNIDRVVYVYALQPETGEWRYQKIVDIGEVFFGASIDLDGRVALISTASENEAGSAHVVRL